MRKIKQSAVNDPLSRSTVLLQVRMCAHTIIGGRSINLNYKRKKIHLFFIQVKRKITFFRAMFRVYSFENQ